MADRQPVAVSAPGKVLLAGGYLVLVRKHTGLVFGLDARIHCIVQEIPTSSGVVLSEISVKSPQFENAVWHYGYRWDGKDGGMHMSELRRDADLALSRNPFIETALCYALSYIGSVSSPVIAPASITVLADNDYYSTPSDLDLTDGFYNFGVPISKAHKTGLGSSAALVAALTAAVLTHYLPTKLLDITTDIGKRRLHNLAQAAHCAAQGKVGSGFDVASAVYGSCLYKRFSPEILSSHAEPGAPGFASQLRATVDDADSKWDTEIMKDKVKVPEGLRLVMCDVSVGSQTPGMVKQVLAWRKANQEEADWLWDDLQTANDALAKELTALADADATVAPDYSRLRMCFSAIRELIREMGEKSEVPIEPPAQTKLLDACEAVEGVVGGIVPGAGGYDAIALLIQDKQSTVKALKDLLDSWKFKGEGVGGGKVSMLGVREEMEGVRLEKLSEYESEYLQ
ncbi:hypothetical protein B0A48_09821 [Cryoendolithus antarcticus]|uniref:Phosphomevalonate kinase n=1 Tax=Cryoendolithus antarcticus TaxID=1507870 RepID=A0A1V8T3D4_9PEZI|nr:hypothetical protein B0A48_09821 [Cryoendolithus antarcticus]